MACFCEQDLSTLHASLIWVGQVTGVRECKCIQMAYSGHTVVNQGSEPETAASIHGEHHSTRLVCVAINLYSIRFLELWHFCHLPPESPAFWSTLQEHILSASSCQKNLAHLRHINWSSVETFEPFFFLRKKNT